MSIGGQGERGWMVIGLEHCPPWDLQGTGPATTTMPAGPLQGSKPSIGREAEQSLA